jgi:type IV fimbrial biogenesis protein FimT
MSSIRQRGMSLIELMVGITIAALLMGLAVPEFRTAMQNRQIRTAATAIQNGLQLARTEALRRNRNVIFQFTTGNGWQVGCQTPDATVQNGEQVCPQVIQSRDQQEGSANAQVQSFQVTTAGSTAFSGAVSFSPLGRTTPDTLPAGATAQYVIQNPGAGTCAAAGGPMRCLNVVVTSFGQIRTCDPAVAAGDMRAC